MSDSEFPRLSASVSAAAQHAIVLICRLESTSQGMRRTLERITATLRDVPDSEMRPHLNRLLAIHLERQDDPIVLNGQRYNSWHEAVIRAVRLLRDECWWATDHNGYADACQDLLDRAVPDGLRELIDASHQNWSVIETDPDAWPRLMQFLNSQEELAAELREAVDLWLEREKLLALATGEATKKCRIRIERTRSETFAYLDNVKHSISDKAAEFLEAGIHASGDYFAMPSGCKTRDVDSLPEDIQRLIERTPAKGSRIIPSAWRN